MNTKSAPADKKVNFANDGPADGNDLASMIMAKMNSGDFIDGDRMDSMSEL